MPKLFRLSISPLPPHLYPEADLSMAKRHKLAVLRHRLAILLERIAKLERRDGEQRERDLQRRCLELITQQFRKQTAGTVLAATKKPSNRRV